MTMLKHVSERTTSTDDDECEEWQETEHESEQGEKIRKKNIYREREWKINQTEEIQLDLPNLNWDSLRRLLPLVFLKYKATQITLLSCWF